MNLVRITQLSAPCSALSLVLLSLGLASPDVSLAQPVVPVTDAMLQDPAPEDWLMWRRTLDGWGYSPLDQIDRDNVAQLRMIWTRALSEGSNQGTPLVHGGVMYMPLSLIHI